MKNKKFYVEIITVLVVHSILLVTCAVLGLVTPVNSQVLVILPFEFFVYIVVKYIYTHVTDTMKYYIYVNLTCVILLLISLLECVIGYEHITNAEFKILVCITSLFLDISVFISELIWYTDVKSKTECHLNRR